MPRKPVTAHAERTGCPIAFGVDLFGDRWTLLLLRDLLIKRKRYYTEFLESEEGIATNVLADRLQKLEAAGIVEKSTSGRRVRYRATSRGRDLLPVLLEIVRWSGRHDPATAAPASFLAKLERDPDGLRRYLLAELDKADRD